MPPLDLFVRAAAAVERLAVGGGDGADIPIRIEHRLPDGTVEDLPLPL